MKILITGGSSGIGYDLARTLSNNGHLVYITTHTDIEQKRMREKITNEKLNILVFKLDITDSSQRKLIEKIDIDCLILNAGKGEGGSVLEIDIDVLRDNYETNVFSNFSLIKDFYQKKKREKKIGKVFVMSSLAAFLPIPYLGCYTSSKTALTSLCMTLKKELKDLGECISISVIEAGAYHTGFNQVMIDNKEKNIETNLINSKLEKINARQRKFFSLIEKNSTSSLIKKVIKEIEKKKPKFKIKVPLSQALFTKLYLLLFW